MHTWFTSDYHLGHSNIIRYCNRPFVNLLEMNRTIVRNHNERVAKDDLVFFIGDFCFKNSPGGKKGEGLPIKASDYIKQLNGHFVFIKGNHDRNNSLKTNIERVVIHYGGKRINLVHNPLHADSNYEINLVGHVHEKWLIRRINDKSIMYNVGVDVNDFRPITFEEIMKNIKKWIKETNEQPR